MFPPLLFWRSLCLHAGAEKWYLGGQLCFINPVVYFLHALWVTEFGNAWENEFIQGVSVCLGISHSLRTAEKIAATYNRAEHCWSEKEHSEPNGCFVNILDPSNITLTLQYNKTKRDKYFKTFCFMSVSTEITILHKVNIWMKEPVFPQCFQECWNVTFHTALFLMLHSVHKTGDGSCLEPCNDFITVALVLPFLIIPSTCLLYSIVTRCFKLYCKQFGEVLWWIFTEYISIRKINPLWFPCCQWKDRNGFSCIAATELTPNFTRPEAFPSAHNRRSLWRLQNHRITEW